MGTNTFQRRAAMSAAVCLLSAAVAIATAATVQGTHPVSGRAIARVMGHEGADWLDRPERLEEEQPERALDAIDIAPGAAVADVGAGTGYFTVRLSRRVGATGRVYATDIQREMLARLDRRLKAENIGNVELVQGSEDDPGLAPQSVDLVLMVDVYHELARPQQVLRRLRTALRPGGRLVLIEYRKEDPSVPIRLEHKMSVKEARQELEAEGFVLARQSDVLPRQHILIFQPIPQRERPDAVADVLDDVVEAAHGRCSLVHQPATTSECRDYRRLAGAVNRRILSA